MREPQIGDRVIILNMKSRYYKQKATVKGIGICGRGVYVQVEGQDGSFYLPFGWEFLSTK